MRILQIIANAEYGGLPRHVLTLSKALADRGHHVHVLSMGDGPFRSEFERSGIPFEAVTEIGKRIRRDPLTAIRAVMRVRDVLDREFPQIIHSHGPRAHFFSTVGGIGGKHVPLVASVHGSFKQFISGTSLQLGAVRKLIKKAQYRNLDRLVALRAVRIVAVCDATREELLHELKIKSEKVEVIHNGIEDKHISLDHCDEIRREFGLQPDDCVVCYVGSMSYHKGLNYLMDASEAVTADNQAARFLFVGEGPMEAYAGEWIQSEQLADKVILAGRRSDAIAIIAASDVLVLPSLSEGLSLTLLEAAMLGKPMVATDVGGNPEVVIDGSTGLLIPPRDSSALASSLGLILADKTIRSRMGGAARDLWQREFTVELMVSRMEALYQEVISAV